MKNMFKYEFTVVQHNKNTELQSKSSEEYEYDTK